MKRYLIVIAAIFAFTFSACKNETTSGLDGGVAERIQSIMDGYQNTLYESPHGWIAYIETNQGYYRFWVEFDNTEGVKMISDNGNLANAATKVSESLYSIRHYQRPTLVFDTYSYLAIINDPDNSISKGKDNQGFETDFEFEFVSYEEMKFNVGDGVHTYDAFKMRGRINRANALFIKATQEQKEVISSGRIAEEVREVGAYGGGINNHLYAEIDGKTVNFLVKSRSVLILTEESGKVVMEETTPILEVGSKNMIFLTPVKTAGVMMESLIWDEPSKQYSVVAGDKKFVVNKSTTKKIDLNTVCGYNKPFTKMRLYDGFGYDFIDFIALFFLGIIVEHVDIYLSVDIDTKAPTMVIELSLSVEGTSMPMAFTYYITENTDGSFVTSDKVVFIDDVLLLASEFYPNLVGEFIDIFKSQKYMLEWGNMAPPSGLESETIIMLESATTTASSKNGVMLR